MVAAGICNFHVMKTKWRSGRWQTADGKPFANYWMHAAFLNFGQEKMSKSRGNFFMLREVLDKLEAAVGTQRGATVRFFFGRGHYGGVVNDS